MSEEVKEVIEATYIAGSSSVTLSTIGEKYHLVAKSKVSTMDVLTTDRDEALALFDLKLNFFKSQLHIQNATFPLKLINSDSLHRHQNSNGD